MGQESDPRVIEGCVYKGSVEAKESLIVCRDLQLVVQGKVQPKLMSRNALLWRPSRPQAKGPLPVGKGLTVLAVYNEPQMMVSREQQALTGRSACLADRPDSRFVEQLMGTICMSVEIHPGGKNE